MDLQLAQALMPAQVLIVGAGPTGLTLACELLRRGITVRVIDQAEGPSPYSRALGVQARTLETLERMGIIEPFLEKGLKASGFTAHFGKKTITVSLEHLPSAFPYVLLLPQTETEAILTARLHELGGRIEWQTSFVDLQTLSLPNGTQERHGIAWIVGCDGAHSQVRHILGLRFEGAPFPETFFLSDVQAKTEFPIDHPHLFFTKMGFAVVIPLPTSDVYRLIFPIQPQELPMTIEKTLWSSEFHLHRRLTSAMRVGSVFLAGDAAHLHSPAGGQGMNTSIQDAMNLGWKLSAVIRGDAKPEFLDTFEKERRPVALRVLKGTTLATKLLTHLHPAFLKPFLKLLRRPLTLAVSELNVKYGKSSGKSPKAGERAPEVWLSDGSRLLPKLFSDRFVLLLFEEKPWKIAHPWVETRVVTDREVMKTYRAGQDTGYLIRPDGVIGYSSHTLTPEGVNSYLSHYFVT